jgi:hypothetical protein
VARAEPVVWRQSPFLPGLAERVGRRTDGSVEDEIVAAAPDICAVEGHHEGEITEDFDVGILRAHTLQLFGGFPLQVLDEEHVFRQPHARLGEGVRIPVPKRGRPLDPGALALLSTQNAVQAVFVKPPVFLLDIGPEALGLVRLPEPLRVVEPLERGFQRALLQPAHGAVIDARGSPHRRECIPCHLLEGVGIIEHPDADELRIDRHRAERRVRRRLAGRKLVEREELEHRLGRGSQPRGSGGNVSDLADAPAAGGSQREERYADARTALPSNHRSRPISRKSARNADENAAGSGRRLSTR